MDFDIIDGLAKPGAGYCHVLTGASSKWVLAQYPFSLLYRQCMATGSISGSAIALSYWLLF